MRGETIAIEQIAPLWHKSRVMLRAIPALFMVLLIGNPVCCCTLAGTKEEARPACCQERAGGADSTPAEESLPTCPCAKRMGAVVADKLLVPLPVLLAPLPSLLPNTERLIFLERCLAPVDSSWTKPPPGYGSPEPFHVLYGVFRC